MKLHRQKFLGEENDYFAWEAARFVVLPVPYEGAVSYGRGAAAGPQAILDASCFVEFYDEELRFCPHEVGIAAAAPTPVSDDHAEMHEIVYQHTREIVQAGKIPVLLGGDHSISSGAFRALKANYPKLGCIQFDAHADLRPSYEGSIYSHASVMARIREMTPYTLQLGIRALSEEEAKTAEALPLCTMQRWRSGGFDVEKALDQLPADVYVTFDVDAFDWSVIWSTGTPEPGGFGWYEALALLRRIFASKRVVGFDVVELAPDPRDRNSSFAAARLVYKMIGFAVAVERGAL